MNKRFDGIAELIAATNRHIDAEGETTRRHFDVVAEGLSAKIKLIAEGHGVLVGHMVDVKGGVERLEAGQTGLVLRLSVVESRLTDVEKTQKITLAEVRGLAARRL